MTTNAEFAANSVQKRLDRRHTRSNGIGSDILSGEVPFRRNIATFLLTVSYCVIDVEIVGEIGWGRAGPFQLLGERGPKVGGLKTSRYG